MSDTFVVAARIRVAKKEAAAAFNSTWKIAIENPRAMYRGWFWKKRVFSPKLYAPAPKSIAHWFAALADHAAEMGEPGSLIAAYDGEKKSIVVYHLMFGFDDVTAFSTLNAIAAASAHRTRRTPDYAVLFSTSSGRLSPEGALAVLEVNDGRARFVGGSEVTIADVMKDLGPAEERSLQAIEGAAMDEEFLHPQIRKLTRHPSFKKKKKRRVELSPLERWRAHYHALAGEKSPVPGMIAALEVELDLHAKGGCTTACQSLAYLLFYEEKAIAELLTLRRARLPGVEAWTADRPEIAELESTRVAPKELFQCLFPRRR